MTLSALNCISQLENDYGITKDAAFWSNPYLVLLFLGDGCSHLDALVVLQPAGPNFSSEIQCKYTYRKRIQDWLGNWAGTDFAQAQFK